METYTDVKLLLEGQWQKLVDICGGEEKLMMCLGTTLAMIIPFVIVNSFFIVLDLTGKPSCLMKYKIQKGKNTPVDTGRLLYCIFLATFNELTSCVLFALCFPILKARGVSALNPLPDIWTIVLHYYIMGYCNEFMFYYFHRLLHWPPFYKRFHKIHHQWKAPISVCSSYQHPVENVIQKFGPVFLGTFVMGSHISITWYYVLRAQISTFVNHSDFHFPGLSSPQFHDYHHLYFNECFGGGLLDWFHQTDKQFQNSIQCKRHITYYSLTPIDVLLPEESKKE